MMGIFANLVQKRVTYYHSFIRCFSIPRLENSSVHVSWDIENVSVPKGYTVTHVVQNIIGLLNHEKIEGRVTISTFGVVKNLTKVHTDLCQSSWVHFEGVQQGKNSADDALKVEIEHWANQNPPPNKYLWIISGDGGFKSVMRNFRDKGYVIFMSSIISRNVNIKNLPTNIGIGNSLLLVNFHRYLGSWSSSSIFSNFNASEKLLLEANQRDSEIDLRLLKMGDRIASGFCGDVFHGIYLGQAVAVKTIKSEHLNNALENEFKQEVSILRNVHHKNVVGFIGVSTKSPQWCLVTEFMPGGSLYDYLHKHNSTLELYQLLKFAIDVSSGMDYLHQNNILHRDLKTANLLMDTHDVVKVADFGVARFLNQGGVMTAETGTYRWMAPEVINHQPYDQKADVFSFSIVLWELVTAKLPYDNMTPLQAALGVRQGLRPKLPNNAHPKLLKLMEKCWEATPSKRPSFSEITNDLENLHQEIQKLPEVGA